MRRLFRIETLFALGMWAVSLALAFFLVGFGSLVVSDLPQIDDPVTVETYIDRARADRLQAERDALTADGIRLDAAADAAALVLRSAEADTIANRAAFEDWVATRTATGEVSSNAELVTRTARLEDIRAAERRAREALDAINAQQYGRRDRALAINAELEAVYEAAAPALRQAEFVQEAQVFGLRLALTLPLLAVALWALRTRSGSRLWPLWRGFILFAAFTFFVELVPYLPSYGGYVHYGVGALATVITGSWLIRAARRHLARRAEVAARSETERRAAIAYDEALEKTAKQTCPSCDRTLRTTDDAKVNFCVHCGLRLYEACPACGVRRLVFFPFCMNCGAATEPAAAPASTAPRPDVG